jgi:low temperature requirement protein LtrA
MTGLAVVAPNFDPTTQIGSTFRVMCKSPLHFMEIRGHGLIQFIAVVLLVSRVVIACQYGSIIWHVRNYKNTKLPLGLMVGINLVAAIIYLGLVFGFQDYNTYVYVAWYVVAIVEIIITVGLSLRWKVLSFKGTHLINRMAMLTFIMLGEGIIVVCLGVGRIVKNPDAWSKFLFG